MPEGGWGDEYRGSPGRRRSSRDGETENKMNILNITFDLLRSTNSKIEPPPPKKKKEK
jgi:hypothetical protein